MRRLIIVLIATLLAATGCSSNPEAVQKITDLGYTSVTHDWESNRYLAMIGKCKLVIEYNKNTGEVIISVPEGSKSVKHVNQSAAELRKADAYKAC